MKIKPSEYGELKNHPVFEGLPDELKDIKKYKQIEKKLQLIMVSDHKHTKVSSFVGCKRCLAKMKKKSAAIRDYGFKDYQQYAIWKKVMIIIYNEKDFQVV